MAPKFTLGSRSAAVVAALLFSVLAVPLAAASSASPPVKATSQVYLVHGVPGGPADVSVDGESVASGLASAAVHGPIELTPGRHTVAFAGDGWNVEAPITVENASEDVVVHLPADAAADPIVTVFANEVTSVREGHGRITVAHTAVVPPADIRAGGEVLFANVANGEFVTAEVPADTYEVDVVPTGGDDPLLGPVDLEVTAGALTRVFAIGEPEDGSMTAVVQVIPLVESSSQPPSKVGSGVAGLVDPQEEQGVKVWPAILGAVLMGVALVLHRRRHVRS